MATRRASARASRALVAYRGRTRADAVLAGLVLLASVLEVAFRADLVWRPVAALLGLALAAAVLERRAHPLGAVLVAFGSISAVDLVTLLVGGRPVVLYSGFVVLLLAFSLFRRGSGRAQAVGLAVMASSLAIAVVVEASPVADVVGGAVVLLLAAMLGASVRARAEARAHLVVQVRSEEREQIARELHDTVAHHVSAIAIQAQAGLVLAEGTSASGARDALAVIEREAASTLAEMRSMVGVLRDAPGQVDLGPRRGHADLASLASRSTAATRVEVGSTGVPATIPVAVDAALYRVAQESVTNALRHADHATLVDVRVCGRADEIRLTVTDDGARTASGATGRGFGLLGMEERVRLLGGTLAAGPRPAGGWAVDAVLPLDGGRRTAGQVSARRRGDA